MLDHTDIYEKQRGQPPSFFKKQYILIVYYVRQIYRFKVKWQI